MRFHVLGLGSIGTLIAHHLRRSLRLRAALSAAEAVSSGALTSGSPPAVESHNDWLRYLPPDPASISTTLQLRDEGRASMFKGTTVEHAGVRTFEEPRDFRLEAAGVGQVIPSSGDRPTGLSMGSPYAPQSPKRRQRTADPTASIPDQLASPFLQGAAPAYGPSIVQQLGFTNRMDSIDSLIVTTKADVTTQALRPLVPRLTPASTIVLLQNGMGVMDDVVDTLWPDPSSRPRFLLGNVTHGCWSRKPFETVHAGLGQIFLGVPPSTLYNTGGHSSSNELASLASGAYGSSSSRNTPSVTPAALATSPLHRSLLYTLSTLITIPDLAGKLSPNYQDYLVRALQKLVVNACVNPTTAILDCKNGDVVGDQYAEDIWRDVIAEASDVFLAMALRGQKEQQQRDEQQQHQQQQQNQVHRGYDQRELQPPVSPPFASDAGEETPLRPRRKHRRSVSMAQWSHLIHRRLLGTTAGGQSDVVKGGSQQSSVPAVTSPAVLDSNLTPPSLLAMVRNVAKATSRNYSSMHRDVRGGGGLTSASPWRPSVTSTSAKGVVNGIGLARKRTEIDYLNGWISAMGRQLDVRTDVNDTMVRLVRSLCVGNKDARRTWASQHQQQDQQRVSHRGDYQDGQEQAQQATQSRGYRSGGQQRSSQRWS